MAIHFAQGSSIPPQCPAGVGAHHNGVRFLALGNFTNGFRSGPVSQQSNLERNLPTNKSCSKAPHFLQYFQRMKTTEDRRSNRERVDFATSFLSIPFWVNSMLTGLVLPCSGSSAVFDFYCLACFIRFATKILSFATQKPCEEYKALEGKGSTRGGKKAANEALPLNC